MDTHPFFSVYAQGFARVASCCTPIHLANPQANCDAILSLVQTLAQQHISLCLFPELNMCGYSNGDLLTSETLQQDVQDALIELANKTRQYNMLIVVGAPLKHHGQLFNCAVVLHKGEILGIVPKTFLPNDGEFQEHRYFSSGQNLDDERMTLGDKHIPFGTDLLFQAADLPDFTLALEICEDLWAPIPPSSLQTLRGATIIGNLSASPAMIGKNTRRQQLYQNQSSRCHCGYLFAASGAGESTTDLCWDGELAICEDGHLLKTARSLDPHPYFIVADIDLRALQQSRLRHSTFKEQASFYPRNTARTISFKLQPKMADIGFKRPTPRFPFLADTHHNGADLTKEICALQCAALRQRLQACRAKGMIVGVSGGIDSAQALLIAMLTARQLGWDRNAVRAYGLIGFGTSEQSLKQATGLMEAFDCYHEILDIRDICRDVLTAIGHPYAQARPVYDVTFENVQAGLRTDLLFRLANQHHSIVIGTGDMSELALGWCTYGVGDQMSHYNVNCGLPKTILQYMFEHHARNDNFTPQLRQYFHDIESATISPELVPAHNADIQDTQQSIGPYTLQDFTLYYLMKYGFTPERLAFLAYQAWGTPSVQTSNKAVQEKKQHYTLSEIKKWLGVFMERFFAKSQFKRSAMPNGPKIFPYASLSPRGDLRLPSDGNAAIWLDNLKKYVPDS